ncbi:hypothetical protein AJ80_03351 [Polytolypa hystricis UAMH7299]|uniref:Uncharacterized protein n=1 Tax=Polytolypa hystricis (strain UAMH7299) TaxID=1447883 RepID=A0A2B7YJQ9_POLH7|nr:hypothetical protein AJ80_03351 [Polytolypa hystricis UAMH7299]
MSTADIQEAEQILQNLLGRLQQNAAATKIMSDKAVNLYAVIRESLAMASRPHGHKWLIRYAMWREDPDPFHTHRKVHRADQAHSASNVFKGMGIYALLLAHSTWMWPRSGSSNTAQPLQMMTEPHWLQVQGPLGQLKLRILSHIYSPGGRGEDPNSVKPQVNAFKVLQMSHAASVGNFGGQIVDQPGNAMTLEPSTHVLFGRLKIYFEPVQGLPNTYTVHHVDEPLISLSRYPCNITFRAVSQIPLPDPGLLAIHRACAKIAHASGAAEVAMNAFPDIDDPGVRADGSTPSIFCYPTG